MSDASDGHRSPKGASRGMRSVGGRMPALAMFFQVRNLLVMSIVY